MRYGLVAGVCAFALSGAAWAGDVTYRFEWQGAGGYLMQGALSFDDALMSRQLIVEEDIACFVIDGYKDAEPVGRWALGMRTEETTWQLTFDPVLEELVVWSVDFPMPQAWNMNGAGTNCGEGGFGFNIGNAAQDLCLDGKLLRDSQIDPSRPMPTLRDDNYTFPSDACAGVMLMGRLD